MSKQNDFWQEQQQQQQHKEIICLVHFCFFFHVGGEQIKCCLWTENILLGTLATFLQPLFKYSTFISFNEHYEHSPHQWCVHISVGKRTETEAKKPFVIP